MNRVWLVISIGKLVSHDMYGDPDAQRLIFDIISDTILLPIKQECSVLAPVNLFSKEHKHVWVKFKLVWELPE